MKYIVKSFLFFCLVTTVSSFSQQPTDSLVHYVELYGKPQKATDFSDAYQFIVKTKNEALDNDLYERATYSWYHLASIDHKLGFYSDSEASLTEALKLLDNYKSINNKKWYRKSIYTLFGMLYREQFNEEMSIKMYEKAFQYAESSKDSLTLYNNISNLYKDEKQYNLARNELQKALPLLARVNDTLAKARFLDNLGFTYSKLNFKNADSLLYEALKLRKLKEDPKSIFTSYMSLSEHYKDRSKTKIAREFSLKALYIANTMNSASYREYVLGFLTELSNDEYGKAYKKLNDSLSRIEQIRENKFALMKYNVSEKERLINEKELELRTIELEKERSEKLNLIYLSIGVFIFFTSLFLYYLLKSKHKKDKIQEVYLTETRLSKKVHDELANDISDTMNFVENNREISKNNKTLLLDNLEDIYIRTRDISTETASINLIDFSLSLKQLLMQHNKQGTKVIINDVNTVNWSKASDHIKLVIYRSLQELMVNMKKHSQAKVVSIVFKTEKGQNEIRYVDDGVGTSISNIVTNGLENVESRIKNIGGTFSFDTSNGNGFKAILKFKI